MSCLPLWKLWKWQTDAFCLWWEIPSPIGGNSFPHRGKFLPPSGEALKNSFKIGTFTRGRTFHHWGKSWHSTTPELTEKELRASVDAPADLRPVSAVCAVRTSPKSLTPKPFENGYCVRDRSSSTTTTLMPRNTRLWCALSGF